MPRSRRKTKLSLALRSGASCLGLLGLYAPVALAGGGAGADMGGGLGGEMEFNMHFLQRSGGGGADLRYFEQGNALAPGSYRVDVYLNLALKQRREILFSANAQGHVLPVIPVGLLQDLGVDVARLRQEGLIAADADNQTAIDVAAMLPGARAEFDPNQLALMISIPQAYVPRAARGYVDRSLWDTGVNAFHVNYQANFSRNSYQGSSSDYRHVSLRSGLNLSGWRLRNDASFSDSNGQRHFRSQRTFVERDIARWNSKLAVGDLYTPGDVFDSLRFRGVQLSTDQGMLPSDLNGYAPIVRGIAETNATVEVHQNGYVIYSTAVSPGAFEIRDIYPSGSNGDLLIKVLESDGRVREFTQAYAALPVMVRRGNLRYSATAGEYRSGTDLDTPGFVQGTLVYGATDNLTTYGGAQVAEDFQALNLGVGVNSRLGGLSLDVTGSRSRLPNGQTDQGYSARFLYAKTLTGTHTTLTMAGYRYSTEGYRTFGEHVQQVARPDDWDFRTQKSRLDFNVNQQFGSRGSLYLSAGDTRYWNSPGRTRNYQFGYSGRWGFASYNLALARTRDDSSSLASSRSDTQFTASVSIPLGGRGLRGRTHNLYASSVSSRDGNDSVQAGLSGYLDAGNTVNYSLQASRQEGSDTTASASVSWDAPLARLSGSYAYGDGSHRADFNASGSLVVHRGGVTLGQPVGETFGLIEVPKARGVGVTGWNGVRTNRRGHAVVPYLQPYRLNNLNLDTQTLGSQTDVGESAMQLVPTRGAVVRARYNVETGRRVQLRLQQADGSALPFGAMVYDLNDKTLGMIDNQSRALVFGVGDEGRLDVRWNGGACTVDYRLPPANPALTYERLDLVCHLKQEQ